MKFIEAGQVSLAYLEKNPQFEKTVYFIHGNSGSCRTWRKQFCYEFFNSYRLIAFDLPAHGQSSASDNPTHDYSPITTGQIIATAIKNLANDNSYALVGFSYGTNVIAEALNHNLKPAGIVLNASCVIG